MQRTKLFFLGLCIFSFSKSFSQTAELPTSLQPASPKTAGFFSPSQPKKKVFQYKKTNVKHTAQYEFYERVEKAAKARKKLQKKLAKPQYANPLFFGHKNKPKKRSPEKMRYCEVCGIRH